jgi:hypothetical protein
MTPTWGRAGPWRSPVGTHTHTHTYTHRHTYIHTHTQIHTHTYIHTHIVPGEGQVLDEAWQRHAYGYMGVWVYGYIDRGYMWVYGCMGLCEGHVYNFIGCLVTYLRPWGGWVGWWHCPWRWRPALSPPPAWCIIIIGVVSVYMQYNCDYFCDTCNSIITSSCVIR